MDPHLPLLAQHARSLGMRVTATTNATVLTDRRLDEVMSSLAGIAVSVDGPPDQHNKLRGTPWAFDRMLEGLATLRRHQIPFGLIHTLTTESVEHLPWLADFAADQEARLFQIHPLELVGRASSSVAGLHPAKVLARAYMVALFLAAAYRGRLAVQLDAFLRSEIVSHPEMVYAESSCRGSGCEDLPRTLVIEADGTVVPVAWGFSHRYSIASLQDERLGTGWLRWAATRQVAFRNLSSLVFDMIERNKEVTVVNWLELLVAGSNSGMLELLEGRGNCGKDRC